jgi:hypothetical protein
MTLPVVNHSDRRFGHSLTQLHEACNTNAIARGEVHGNQGLVGTTIPELKRRAHPPGR